MRLEEHLHRFTEMHRAYRWNQSLDVVCSDGVKVFSEYGGWWLADVLAEQTRAMCEAGPVCIEVVVGADDAAEITVSRGNNAALYEERVTEAGRFPQGCYKLVMDQGVLMLASEHPTGGH